MDWLDLPHSPPASASPLFFFSAKHINNMTQSLRRSSMSQRSSNLKRKASLAQRMANTECQSDIGQSATVPQSIRVSTRKPTTISQKISNHQLGSRTQTTNPTTLTPKQQTPQYNCSELGTTRHGDSCSLTPFGGASPAFQSSVSSKQESVSRIESLRKQVQASFKGELSDIFYNSLRIDVCSQLHRMMIKPRRLPNLCKILNVSILDPRLSQRPLVVTC